MNSNLTMWLHDLAARAQWAWDIGHNDFDGFYAWITVYIPL